MPKVILFVPNARCARALRQKRFPQFKYLHLEWQARFDTFDGLLRSWRTAR